MAECSDLVWRERIVAVEARSRGHQSVRASLGQGRSSGLYLLGKPMVAAAIELMGPM